MSRIVSQRSKLTDELIHVLRSIRPPEYRTQIGRAVFVGQTSVEDIERPFCVLNPGTDSPAEDAGLNAHVLIQYTISGFVDFAGFTLPEFSYDQSYDYPIVDAIIADIRDSIEGSECGLVYAASVAYLDAIPFHLSDAGTCGAAVRYQMQTPHIDYMP